MGPGRAPPSPPGALPEAGFVLFSAQSAEKVLDSKFKWVEPPPGPHSGGDQPLSQKERVDPFSYTAISWDSKLQLGEIQV